MVIVVLVERVLRGVMVREIERSVLGWRVAFGMRRVGWMRFCLGAPGGDMRHIPRGFT